LQPLCGFVLRAGVWRSRWFSLKSAGNVTLAQRNGRGSRLFGRGALPSDLASRRSRCGLRNNRNRAHSKAGRQLRSSPSRDNRQNKGHRHNMGHRQNMGRRQNTFRRSTVRTLDIRRNSPHIRRGQSRRKLELIAERSVSFSSSSLGIRIGEVVCVSGRAAGPRSFFSRHYLYHALVEHGVGHLYEASYVRADHQIARLPVLFRSVPGVFKDCRHDVAQARIDLLARPW
jgi:hypothetical protein